METALLLDLQGIRQNTQVCSGGRYARIVYLVNEFSGVYTAECQLANRAFCSRLEEYRDHVLAGDALGDQIIGHCEQIHGINIARGTRKSEIY